VVPLDHLGGEVDREAADVGEGVARAGDGVDNRGRLADVLLGLLGIAGAVGGRWRRPVVPQRLHHVDAGGTQPG
jgi:hypothetical protein